MSNKFPEVSQPQKPLEMSENVRKPQKPHDLETYVGFPGNLLRRISVETYGNLWKSMKIYENLRKFQKPGIIATEEGFGYGMVRESGMKGILD